MTEYSSSRYVGTVVEIAKQFEIDHPDVEFSIDAHDNARLTLGDSTFVVGTEWSPEDDEGNTFIDGYTYSIYSSSEDLDALEPYETDGDDILDSLADRIASWYAEQK